MDSPDGTARIQRKIDLIAIEFILRNAFDTEIGRRRSLPLRVRLEAYVRVERRIYGVISKFDQLARCHITFPEFPSEFLDRFLPCYRPDHKSAAFVDIDRLENISTAGHEICREKEILVKAISLRINEVDLIFCETIDHEHHVRQCVRSALLIDACERIERRSRRDRSQRIVLRGRYLGPRLCRGIGSGALARSLSKSKGC